MVGKGADRRGQQVRAVCSHPRAVVRRGPAPPAPSGQRPRQRALLLLLASQRAWGPGIQTRVPLSPAFGDPFASSLVPPHSRGSAVPALTAVTGEAPAAWDPGARTAVRCCVRAVPTLPAAVTFPRARAPFTLVLGEWASGAFQHSLWDQPLHSPLPAHTRQV